MKVISQETFDSVVLENVVEFDNSLEEAVEDAIKEFEAQGVSLLNIVKNQKLSDDKTRLIHNILEFLKKIENCSSQDELCDSLKNFSDECKVSLAHRVLATKQDAYKIILDVITRSKNDSDILAPSLRAMAGLTITNSDIINGRGVDTIIELLKDYKGSNEATVLEQLFRWCQECCLKHEENRQTFYEAGVPGCLVSHLDDQSLNPKAARACLRALRTYTLDDDIRKEFSKAHDHARGLVEEHSLIQTSLQMLEGDLTDADLVSEILLTLAKLCVRAEYCQQAVDNGALRVINNILVSFPEVANLNKQAINLLKTICGNDAVKDHGMKMGGAHLVVAAFARHQDNEGLCEAACGCVSMLALRVPANAKVLCQIGAGEAVVMAMKIHPNCDTIQKFGCLAIRNLSNLLKENQDSLKASGAEAVITEALQKYSNQPQFVDMAKAALRDLGCDVYLEEQWKGTGKEIERD